MSTSMVEDEVGRRRSGEGIEGMAESSPPVAEGVLDAESSG